MRYRRNTDETYRKLERAAATDPALIPELENMRRRLGLCVGCGGPPKLGEDLCRQCGPLELSWDTGQIVENQIKFLMEEYGEEMSRADAERNTQEDYDLFNIHWEGLCDGLTDWMGEINPEKRDWCVEGGNMGWRRTSGSVEIPYSEASTGGDLLQKILPRTECTFTIYNNGIDLEITNSHHDGNESYIITMSEHQCLRCGDYYCSETDAKNCCDRDY